MKLRDLRKKKCLPVIIGGLLLSGLLSSTPAYAWFSSGTVILSGRIQPSAWDINTCVKSLTLSTPDGLVYGAGLGAGCYPSYSFVFNNVPGNGFTVNYVITYSGGSKYSNSFTLKRPWNTYYATVSLYQKR